MERYALLLTDALSSRGLSAVLQNPANVFGRFAGPAGRFQKHLAYLDKFILFPRQLARTVATLQPSGSVILHVLDQGNAPYAQGISGIPVLITCHDLIAAKAALLGPREAGPATRPLGHWFHSRVLQALQRCQTVICDSDKTLSDCRLLLRADSPRPQLARVHVPLDPFFHNAVEATSPAPLFLLHVGNSAWYKNRPGLFRIYAELRKLLPQPPALHLYGEPLQEHEYTLLADLELQPHVTCHPRASNEAIRIAYHQAAALIFPSLEEGFGWPPLEAMACGCPVFTSNRPPLTEIGGDAAEYIDPENPAQAAALIASRLRIGAPWRQERAEAGRVRAAEFNMERFTSEMIAVYESVLNR